MSESIGKYGFLERVGESKQGWQELAIEAVGNVIEFWGFKRNQGRVWALLFLRDEPLSAVEIQEALELSKGAVSMLLRDLESWTVIKRTRRPGLSGWAYAANSNLMDMISQVLTRREVEFLQNVVGDLERAEALVERDPKASASVKKRVKNMRRLGAGVLDAVSLFARTARLDFRGLVALLAGRAADVRKDR